MMLPIVRQQMIVVRGRTEQERTALARALAGRLTGPTASLSFEAMRDAWLRDPGRDAGDEQALLYRLLKLLAVSFLKDGYSVVLDAPYPPGEAAELRDLLRLARTFRGVRPASVRLGDAAPDAVEDDIVVRGTDGDVEALAREVFARIDAQ